MHVRSFLSLRRELRGCFSHEVECVACNLLRPLKELLMAEGLILKQRLKQDWVANMDRGSSYFYYITKSRCHRMRISSLYTEEGVRLVGQRDIGLELSRFFSKLLGADRPVCCALNPKI
ncbi:hypothetical protein Dimus_008604, partial [Dionaea muscipula]